MFSQNIHFFDPGQNLDFNLTLPHTFNNGVIYLAEIQVIFAYIITIHQLRSGYSPENVQTKLPSNFFLV